MQPVTASILTFLAVASASLRLLHSTFLAFIAFAACVAYAIPNELNRNASADCTKQRIDSLIYFSLV